MTTASTQTNRFDLSLIGFLVTFSGNIPSWLSTKQPISKKTWKARLTVMYHLLNTGTKSLSQPVKQFEVNVSLLQTTCRGCSMVLGYYVR